MKKLIYKALIVLLAVIITFTGLNSFAATGYTYDHNKKVIYSTEGLIYDHSFDGLKLGMGYAGLISPEDLFVYRDKATYTVQNMYITDSATTILGNIGAIYELDANFNLLRSINSFKFNPGLKDESGNYVFSDDVLKHMKNNGTALLADTSAEGIQAFRDAGEIDLIIKAPRSTFRYVVEKLANHPEYLYVCDYGNNQALVIDYATDEIKLVITDPNGDVPASVFSAQSFQPKKVVADNAGRIYIIADGVYEGILQFDPDGTYKRFTGVNYITLTAWNIFWLTIATEAQYENKQQYINTTFTGMALDITGTFIYSTANPIVNDNGGYNTLSMIKKLNPAGKDVLRRNGYFPPQGDITYIASSPSGAPYPVGPSSFNCIAVNEYGVYTVVDNNRNKLFTYDAEGNLLYISSESGSYSNTLSTPVAIQYDGDDLLVLDKGTKEIKVFVPTEIGGYINDATAAESTGDVDDAAAKWAKVIQYNANYEYAYVGVGKGYLKNKDYKNAMEYFRQGSNKLQYSEAYKLYRNNLIKRYAPIVLYSIIGLVVIVKVTKLILKKTGHLKVKEKEQEDLGE